MQWGRLEAGTKIRPAGALFPRIRIEKPKAPEPSAPEGVALIGFEDLSKVALRTARVLEAEPVPGADKLLKLKIDLGSEQRTIVAGVAQHYAAADLVGRTIVVVANLEPATIRGVESQGMLLAASEGKTLRLVTVDGEIAPGAKVK